MARARNIKPGVFKNEILVELPAFTRLLFIGLWTMADREGRVEDRPKRIKLELFPYDSDDINAALDSLTEGGFIHRYESSGVKVISIDNFLKHQNPHGTEKDSDLPDESGNLTVHERDKKGYVTGTKRVNNVKSSINNVSTTEVNVDPVCNNALNPESLFTDSLNTSVAKATVSPAKLPTCPHTEIIDLFAKHLPELPQSRPEMWTGARANALRSRWKWILTAKKRNGDRYASNGDEALAWMERFFSYVAESDFLTGRTGKFNSCDLGWLVNEANFFKVLQGNYDNKQKVAA